SLMFETSASKRSSGTSVDPPRAMLATGSSAIPRWYAAVAASSAPCRTRPLSRVACHVPSSSARARLPRLRLEQPLRIRARRRTGGSAMTMTVPQRLDFEIDVLLDDLPDVAGTQHEMRAHGPAVWARGFGEPALLLLTHELVNAAFRDEDTFPAAAFYGTTVTDVLGRNLQCMYGDEHRLNRALVSPAFRQR